MKKLINRFVVFVLTFAIILSTGIFNSISAAFASEKSSYKIDANAKGTTFSTQSYFETEKGLSALPHTFEAVVKIPKGFGTERAGCIISNYHAKGDAAISFELQTGGYPRLYLKNDTDTGVTDITFSNVVVTNDNYDGYFHLAVTLDDSTNTAKCYVNGELKETKSYDKDYANLGITLNNLPFGSENGSFRIGNDYRPGNAQYFKGSIKSVALYSGVKTSFDANSIALTSDLVCAYDLSDVSALGEDLSSNDNDCIFRGYTTFAMDDFYVIDKQLEAKPKTFEAWVKMPATLPTSEHPSESSATARGGVIIGNYKSGSEVSVNFEVTNKGEPRLFFIDETTSLMTKVVSKVIVFSNSKLLNDEWTHVAVTLDTNSGNAKCYINGVLTETKPGFTTDYHNNYRLSKYIIGNDYRGIHNFKGAIKSVAMYSDVRTSTEIASDMANVNLTDANLLASIKTTKMGKTFTDESGNGYDAKYSPLMITDKEPVTDYAYSIAVVGDTQIDNMYDVRNGTTIMSDTYKWIANNVESKKIVQVLGLGDITESASSPVVSNERQKEWANAKASITQLDGKVGYSLVRGNHDVISDFESNFGSYDAYTSQFEGFYDNSILNSYKLFTAGGTDYLLLTLDYGASDAVLEWACDVCESYPDRKVIVTTHAYLYRDGTTLSTGDVCEPAASTDKESSFATVTRDYNNGEDMWNGLIKKCPNIFMVLSGHDPSIEVVYSEATGENGNTIIQLLVDPQGLDKTGTLQGNVEGPFGMVTMLYFSADGKQVDVETYSTRYDAYHMANNQFTIELPCETHVYNQMVQNAKYLKEKANCQHGNIYYKSCVCGAYATTADVFDDGIIGDHVFDKKVISDSYLVSEADCEHGKIYKKSCFCGEAGETTFEEGKGSHSYVLQSTVAPNWSARQDGYEVWVCENDNSHVENRPISWETLSATLIITNGNVNGESQLTVELGSTITVVADTIEGKRFVKWMMKGSNVGTDNEYTLTVNSKVVSITAYFEDYIPTVEPENPPADGGSAQTGCQMSVNEVDCGLGICFASLLIAAVMIKRKKNAKNR